MAGLSAALSAGRLDCIGAARRDPVPVTRRTGDRRLRHFVAGPAAGL